MNKARRLSLVEMNLAVAALTALSFAAACGGGDAAAGSSGSGGQPKAGGAGGSAFPGGSGSTGGDAGAGGAPIGGAANSGGAAGAAGGGAGEAGGGGSGGQASGGAGGSAEPPVPFGQDATKFVLTFSDEFEGKFDTSIWNDHIWYESSDATKNYEVENGSLRIWPQKNAQGKFVNRTIDTDGKYYQTYGYFEIEAKLPIGKGTWPAFWLFNHIDERRPEIDIMEAYAGGGPSSGWGDSDLHPVAYGATIWLDAGKQGGFKIIQTPDLSAAFHRYALLWEPTQQTFYFDGKEVYSANVTMSDPMYIMLDLWFGSASGQPDDSTPTGPSNSFEVEYVRAWKLK